MKLPSPFFLTLLLVPISGIIHAGAFTLKGRIKGMRSGYIYLYYNVYSPSRLTGVGDSCLINDGRFAFRGNIGEPTNAVLQTYPIGTRGGDHNAVQFYIEAGKMELSVELNHFGDFQLKGSAAQDELTGMRKSTAAILDSIKSAEGLYYNCLREISKETQNGAKDPSLSVLILKKDSLSGQIAVLNQKRFQADSEFVQKNPDSFVAIAALWADENHMNLAAAKELYGRLPKKILGTSIGNTIKTEINKEAHLAIGSDAKDFTVIGSGGDSIRLAGYKDRKYVLLDFWSSWCVPCRRLTPLLKTLYAQYSGKLEIISIDDEQSKELWRDAVTEDKTSWPQVYDEKSAINNMYYVNFIPLLILMDKDAKIVDKFNGGYFNKNFSELSDDLKNLLDK